MGGERSYKAFVCKARSVGLNAGGEKGVARCITKRLMPKPCLMVKSVKPAGTPDSVR